MRRQPPDSVKSCIPQERGSPRRPILRPHSVRKCDRRGFLLDRFLKICAVLSGGMTALLLTPGTGVCKPGMAYQRDTNRWRRQVTKLPIPIPQYLPFTLRYGFLRCIPRLRRCHTPDSHAGVARAFDVIGLTGRGRGLSPPFAVPGRRQSWRGMADAGYNHLHTGYEREPVPLFVKVQWITAQGANWWRILSSVARSSPVSCALNFTSSAACRAVNFLR